MRMQILFREKYKKDNEMINPSDEFLEKLKIEMKQEQEFKSRHNVKKSRKIFLTAASIALIFIGITACSRISDLQKKI